MKNVPLHTKCQVIRHVMASFIEAKIGVLLHNGKTTIPLHNTLDEIRHQQPPTPIKTDNYTYLGIVKYTSKQKTQSNVNEILLGK